MIPQEIYNLKNLLVQCLGESKKELDESYQLQFACPRCIENKGDAEVEPEHQKNDGGQTSINRGEGSPCIDIEGVQIRKGNPKKGSQNGTGDFCTNRGMLFRDKIVKKRKVYNKQKK